MSLIRRAVLVLDRVESGAPKLSGKIPFGSNDPWGDVQRAFGTSDDTATAAALVNFTNHLTDFSERAELTPGTYAMKNITADDLRREFDWLEADDAYLGLTPDGKVIVTEDHLKLIRGIYWEWPNEYDVEDTLAFDQWPMPAVDGKRPYGDMSFYQLDAHRLLEWPVEKRTADGYIELTEQQIEHGARLHTQMLGVTQVFLERAELPE
ncbi:MAG: hypothetical protein AAF557_02805 [Pseudomonadota bacterium]